MVYWYSCNIFDFTSTYDDFLTINLSNQYLHLPLKKFTFSQISFIDTALAENGHFTSKVAGDAIP